MKIKLLSTVFLFALVAVNTVTQAQITITASDASAINAVGNVITNHYDSTTVMVNIGSPGQTSWDFSALNSHTTNKLISVDPGSSPYISDFPGANVVFNFSDFLEGDTAEAWQYATQNAGEYLMNGLVLNAIIDSDTMMSKNVFSPAELIFPLPFTFNSEWSSDYSINSTIYFNGEPFIFLTSDYTETSVVDAWGNLTMPGGAVLQALRIRKDERSDDLFSNRNISYSFITKFGTAVTVSAVDTTAPNFGIIQTDGVAWSSIVSEVGIADKGQLPVRSSLYQNIPNPAGSGTKIGYSISDRQLVQLKVYNHLGTEVASLVNEQKEAGSYEVKFDASLLPPGNYYYRLQAGNFIDTKKMIIIR